MNLLIVKKEKIKKKLISGKGNKFYLQILNISIQKLNRHSFSKIVKKINN